MIVNLTDIFDRYRISVKIQTLQLISSKGKLYTVKQQPGCIFAVCNERSNVESSLVEFMMNCMKFGWNSNEIMKYINTEIELSKVEPSIMKDFIDYIDNINRSARKNRKLEDFYYIKMDKFRYKKPKYEIINMASVIIEHDIIKTTHSDLQEKYNIAPGGTITSWYEGSNRLRILYEAIIRAVDLDSEKDYIKKLFKGYSKEQIIYYIEEDIKLSLIDSNKISLEIKNKYKLLLDKLAQIIKSNSFMTREQNSEMEQDSERERDLSVFKEQKLEDIIKSFKEDRVMYDPVYINLIMDKLWQLILNDKDIIKKYAKDLDEYL